MGSRRDGELVITGQEAQQVRRSPAQPGELHRHHPSEGCPTYASFCALQEFLEQQLSTSGLQPVDGGQMLCIINGAMAGLSGGALGYVFGFGKPGHQNKKVLLFCYQQ